MDIRLSDMMVHHPIYRGENAVEQFLKSLHQEIVSINAIFAKAKPLHMSDINEKDLHMSDINEKVFLPTFTVCNAICQKEFNDEKEIRKYEITVISWASIKVQPPIEKFQSSLTG